MQHHLQYFFCWSKGLLRQLSWKPCTVIESIFCGNGTPLFQIAIEHSFLLIGYSAQVVPVHRRADLQSHFSVNRWTLENLNGTLKHAPQSVIAHVREQFFWTSFFS